MRVRFDEGDGLLLIGEVGAQRDAEDADAPGNDALGALDKLAFGVWTYTGDFDDFVRVDGAGDPVQRSAGTGLYALGQVRLVADPVDRARGLAGFLRAGLVDEDTFVLDQYLGAGLVQQGLGEGREHEKLGVGVAAARFGDSYREASSGTPGSAGWEQWEVAFELTYRRRITRWLWFQPDLQYIVNPGGDPMLDDAFVLGFRAWFSL